MSSIDYFSRVNRDLLALIPPDAKVVLEIGCGAGALCEAYRRVNPGVAWWGVDNNGDAVKEAKKPGRCTDVYCWDVESRKDTFYDDDTGIFPSADLARVDCFVLGDVLEHLKDPWTTLRRYVNAIAPGAQVLASIPNMQHFSAIYHLLIGEWPRADEGLFDRTHLRWFTLKSIREMFDEAGLQILEVRGIRASNDEAGWKEWLKIAATIDVEGFDLKQTAPLQYLVRAVKPPAEITPLHIHAVTAEGCCARPRILEPFEMLSTIPGVKCTVNPNMVPAHPRGDILILQRQRKFNHKGVIWDGYLTIAEVDDLPEAIGMDPMALKAVHAVQVSTEKLAEVVRQYNPNVMVFENQIAELPPEHGPIMDYQVSLFYGAQNREQDWKPIMPSLNCILREHPKYVEVQVIHDKAFFDALETTEKTFTPFCEYAMYRQILGTCDIALLPLEPGEFNECKSDIKFLECAADGVAVLMSELAAHQLFGKGMNGRTYYWYGESYGFDDMLRELVNNPYVRQKMAERAYAYVRDHRLLGQHYRKRHEWYLDLMSRRAHLHQQLLDRCPELRHQESQSRPAQSATLS